MRKNDFISNIYNRELNTDIKGFLSVDNIKSLRRDTIPGKVLQGMEYRPDKLAAYYLGDEKLGWLLDLTNDFTEGIKEYYLGRDILIPTEDSVFNLKKD